LKNEVAQLRNNRQVQYNNCIGTRAIFIDRLENIKLMILRAPSDEISGDLDIYYLGDICDHIESLEKCAMNWD
jgi:hypothetical protein